MVDLAAALLLIAVIGLAARYVYREKKKGTKCIGCPSAGSCGACGKGSCPTE